MSEPLRILLLGASGLVGRSVLDHAVGRTDLRLVALARREVALPAGSRMEVLLAPPEGWAQAIATIAPAHVICALGTTIRKEGGDEEAFQAVDRDLVLDAARCCKEAGATHFTVVSSAGANQQSQNFYLRTKGDMEAAMQKIGFSRLDILRPGLLRGRRVDDMRPLEKLGMIAGPLTNLALQGERRKFRSILASDVAAAAMQAMRETARGRFMHDYDAIMRLADKFPPVED